MRMSVPIYEKYISTKINESGMKSNRIYLEMKLSIKLDGKCYSIDEFSQR